MNELEKEIIEKENIFFNKRKELKEPETELIELKSKLRQDTITRQFERFVASQDTLIRNSVYLNNVLLRGSIVSYYKDIHRYKDFAGSEWANSYKQAAYTIKWIVKFRPIQIKESTQNVSDKLFDINLIFALVCGFSFLDRKIVDFIMDNKIKTDKENENRKEDEKIVSFYDRLLYVIRYRHLSGKQLMFIFETLKLAC